MFQINRLSSYCNQKVNLFSGKKNNKLYHKADMVRTILETEKIYVSNKIQNINEIAVQAKNCELLTLVIPVRFFIIIIILVCVD